jgi:three-Cys-motif partner protein
MASPRNTHWDITPHTQAKHQILRRYLEAWLPILAAAHNRLVYVDGFAGPGRYTGGEPGSPLIALTTLIEHPRFGTKGLLNGATLLFIESDEVRAGGLRNELDRFLNERHASGHPVPDWVRYHVEHSEFAPTMTRLLDDLDRERARLAPTFCFIDPFGFAGVPMSLIGRIASNPACECLVNFAFDSVRRFLSTPDDKVSAHYDVLFVTRDWRAALAIPKDQQGDFIADFYSQQLVNIGGFRYVRRFEMINAGNRTAYYLNFGTNSKLGLSRMKYAMWRTDLAGGQQFSDRTATGQMVLFEPAPQLDVLKEILQAEFRGRGPVLIEEVEDFVLVKTPFSEESHLKRRTLVPMEDANPPQIRIIAPAGKARRRHTYPPGTGIEFL